jgi:hypothetical protein
MLSTLSLGCKPAGVQVEESIALGAGQDQRFLERLSLPAKFLKTLAIGKRPTENRAHQEVRRRAKTS